MTIDDYIERRNKIILSADAISKDFADRIWVELGVANRHIQRVISGACLLHFVENEIKECLVRVNGILKGEERG